MTNLILLIVCVIVTVLLTRYIVIGTEDTRNQKKFIRDMENFDTKKKKYEPMNNGSKYYLTEDEWVDEDDD